MRNASAGNGRQNPQSAAPDAAHLASQRKIIKTVRDSLAKIDKEQEARLVECDKLEASIRKTVSEYQKKAAGVGKNDLVDALDNFMAGF